MLATRLDRPALLGGNQISTLYRPLVKQTVPNDADVPVFGTFPIRVCTTFVTTRLFPSSHEYCANSDNSANSMLTFENENAVYE